MLLNTSRRGRRRRRGVAIGRSRSADVLMVAVQVQLPFHLDGKMFQGRQSSKHTLTIGGKGLKANRRFHAIMCTGLPS